MDSDITIAQGDVVTDNEIALLRTAVGWDSCAGEYEKILPRRFGYFTARQHGTLVGQQPFGGARASGTNDKAGSWLNLERWVSPRTVKETYLPLTDFRYPYMAEEE